MCDTSGLNAKHGAVANGHAFCHVPLRVCLSDEEKFPCPHQTSRQGILPPHWAEDPEKAEICIGLILKVQQKTSDQVGRSVSLELSASLFRSDGEGIISNAVTGECRWYGEAPTESHLSERGFHLALVGVANVVDTVTVKCDSTEQAWQSNEVGPDDRFVVPERVENLLDRLASGESCRCFLGQVEMVRGLR